jgi:hypothetical protein
VPAEYTKKGVICQWKLAHGSERKMIRRESKQSGSQYLKPAPEALIFVSNPLNDGSNFLYGLGIAFKYFYPSFLETIFVPPQKKVADNY